MFMTLMETRNRDPPGLALEEEGLVTPQCHRDPQREVGAVPAVSRSQ